MSRVFTKVKRSRKKRYRDRKKRQRAASMTVQNLGFGKYHVTGGSEPRTVTINGGADCSCGNGSSPCSHVLAVGLLIQRVQRREASDGNRNNQRRA